MTPLGICSYATLAWKAGCGNLRLLVMSDMAIHFGLSEDLHDIVCGLFWELFSLFSGGVATVAGGKGCWCLSGLS